MGRLRFSAIVGGVLLDAACIEQHPSWNDVNVEDSMDDSDDPETDGTSSGATGNDVGGTDGTSNDDFDTDSESDTGSTTIACSEEVCNGIDDDCDGLIDQGFVTNDVCSRCLTLQFDSRLYWFCDGPMSWIEARDACRDMRAELAAIEDDAHNDFIASQQTFNGGTFSDSMWIGLSDLDVEGEFVWADGTPLTFSAWDQGQPDNLGQEDCVEFLERNAGVWNDARCGDEQAFVCSAPHDVQ